MNTLPNDANVIENLNKELEAVQAERDRTINRTTSAALVSMKVWSSPRSTRNGLRSRQGKFAAHCECMASGHHDVMHENAKERSSYVRESTGTSTTYNVPLCRRSAVRCLECPQR